MDWNALFYDLIEFPYFNCLQIEHCSFPWIQALYYFKSYVFYSRNLPRLLSNILDIFRYDNIVPSVKANLLVPSYGPIYVPQVSRCSHSNIPTKSTTLVLN